MKVWRILAAAVAVACPAVASAEEADAVIYAQTLKVVLEHEKPRKFGVWYAALDATAMTTPRVPRHEPTHQFVRAIPGLESGMERQLAAPRSSGTEFESLPKFDVPRSDGDYAGLLDREKILQAKAQPGSTNFDSWLLVIGFSKIAYGNHGNSALVYSESCLDGPDGSCGGVAYLYAKAASGWRLKANRGLWQGETTPFWDLPGAGSATQSGQSSGQK